MGGRGLKNSGESFFTYIKFLVTVVNYVFSVISRRAMRSKSIRSRSK